MPIVASEIMTSPARQRILDYLREHGGVVADDNGRATEEMAEALGYVSANSLNKIIRAMVRDGEIVREVNPTAKRTYRIELRGGSLTMSADDVQRIVVLCNDIRRHRNIADQRLAELRKLLVEWRKQRPKDTFVRDTWQEFFGGT